ncbi:MAG: response regulator transcription factor [Planctomycetota bacterium]|jgi:DNA-binding response OmpR family regulator
MRSVLIIEDNPATLRGLQDNFEIKGYHVDTARDGNEGLRKISESEPDLIILDIVLPKMNGYDVCRLLRSEHFDVPIIMVTAKNRESDIILGLNVGADDYVIKPFSIQELLARADAVTRRRSPSQPAIYKFGDCQVDIFSEKVYRNDREVSLSPMEFKVLRLLLRMAGHILSYDEIIASVSGYAGFITRRSIDGFVRKLREKIESDPEHPRFIHTVGETGYKFEKPKTCAVESFN